MHFGEGIFWGGLYIITAVVMLFQLRSMLQNSNAEYYHPFSQAVIKLTNPVVQRPPLRNLRLGSFNVAGFAVALALAVLFWPLMFIFLPMPMSFLVFGGLFLFVKSLGFLIIMLLIAQALCSWIPALHPWSQVFGEATSMITYPVRRIIPPIGMIDISLMVVMLAIFALDALITNILKASNMELFYLWVIV